MNNDISQLWLATLILSTLIIPVSSTSAKTLDAGGMQTCGIQKDNTVICWGDFAKTAPEKDTFSQVSAGAFHSCGLRTDESIACWTTKPNDFGQVTPPKGTFLQVSAGFYHSCAVATDHTVTCWQGKTINNYGQAEAPKTETFSQVSAGRWHTCGIRTDGTVTCWGSNTHPYTEWGNNTDEQNYNEQQAIPPTGTFIQLSAAMAGWHTCGVRTDNTVACWGSNDHGQATPPAGTFLQVSSGKWHTCGLRTDNTVTCWGSNSDGQSTPPKDKFIYISAGVFETCGIKTNHTVICWKMDFDHRIERSRNAVIKPPLDINSCFIYGIYENSLGRPQLLTIESEMFKVDPFGSDYSIARENITTLDVHPLTNQLYAASSQGHLYQASEPLAPLKDIGELDIKGIKALSFHPDGTLWGWSPRNGLFQVPSNNDNELRLNKAKIIISDSGEIELTDLTWDISGTVLYGIENVYDEDNSEFRRARLWAYHYEEEQINLVCNNFMSSLETKVAALDILPDDTLLLGFQEDEALNLTVLEIPTCELIIEENIVTELNNIRSLAWPEC